MAKKKTATPTVPNVASTDIKITYELFDLPTAFHKAGLAGLVLLIESLTARNKLDPQAARLEISATRATITFSEELLRIVMDDLYAAKIVEVAVKSKWPGAPLKGETFVEEEVGGKKTQSKRFIYDQVQPQGKFFDPFFDREKEAWRKLWRDMLWNIPRGRPMTREPFNQCASEETCKEGPNAWSELLKVQKSATKNGFHTSELSSALFPGAQAVNAEGVPFMGRAEQNLLLHFWTLTTLIFVPQAIDSDGKTEFIGYSLAVPDVSNLTDFVREYPNLLAALSSDVRGYRPAQAVIDLPAEGALAFLDDLSSLTRLKGEKGEWRSSVSHIEYLHLVKEGNNVKSMASGRISPIPKLLERYQKLVRPADESQRFHHSLFRRGLLVALLEDVPWFQPFGRTLASSDTAIFFRQSRRSDDERGPPQFANDIAKKFRHEFKLFNEALERSRTMPDDPPPNAPAAVIVNRVVRTYLLTRTKDKTGIDPDKFRTAEGEVDYKQIPPEFNEAKQKLAMSLFLEFRSRRDQAFTDHFAATFFSISHRLAEADRLELARLLTVPERRDDLKTLTLLSLSANS